MQLSFHLLFLRSKSEFNGRQICLHQKYIIYVTKVVFIFLFILYLKFQLIEIGEFQILMDHSLYKIEKWVVFSNLYLYVHLNIRAIYDEKESWIFFRKYWSLEVWKYTFFENKYQEY